MTALALGVVSSDLISAVLWTKLVGGKVRDQAVKAERKSDGGELPEQ